MKLLHIKRFAPLCMSAAILVITACGGGGGGGSIAGGGIGGTGVTASGAITGFGSIKLNGLVFDTTNATRVVDGVPVNDDTALAIGMVVTVKGTLSADGINGTADQIEYDDDVQGPIQGPIDEVDQTKTFSVMGIKVRVNKITTVFENTAYASLLAGDLVELSGFFDGTGTLIATRIEAKAGDEVEVRGTVIVPGPFVSTFRLDVKNGAIQYIVDYSAIVNLPPAQGDYVEVKGALAGNTITATEIELEDEGFDDVDKASIEGIVTGFNGVDDFRVAGQRVDATGASFSPAGLAASLADGMQVEVEGPIVNGVLQASEVETRAGEIEIGAMIESVTPDVGGATGSITLGLVPGSLTVLVDSRTSMRDDTEVDNPLTLNDLVAMDYLEVEAYLDDNADLVATEIRRDDADDDLLQGPVDSCGAGMVTILGLGFGLVDGTTSYEDENEGSINTALEFCTQQANGGYLVKIIDKLSGGGPDGTADEAELED